jgi:hypothetical protein
VAAATVRPELSIDLLAEALSTIRDPPEVFNIKTTTTMNRVIVQNLQRSVPRNRDGIVTPPFLIKG